MDEFRSELDGNWSTVIADRVNAPANAIARLQNGDAQSSFSESLGCREPCHAGPNDDDVYSLVHVSDPRGLAA